MTSEIDRTLARGRELHRMLNSRHQDPDLNAQYEAYFSEREKLFNATSKLLEVEGFGVSLHDGFIEGFSERRTAIGWRSTFHVDAIAYGSDDEGHVSEKGYSKLSFTIESRQQLRPMAGREIHTFLVDPEHKKLGAIYHQPGQNMGQVVVDYESLGVEKGPVRTWDELRRQKLASTLSAPAVLRIECGGLFKEYGAQWYVDGTIMVVDGDQDINYNQFIRSPSFFEALDTRADTPFRAWIDTGAPGVSSEVGGHDDDDHGPGYSNTRPLKNWLRNQPARNRSRGP